MTQRVNENWSWNIPEGYERLTALFNYKGFSLILRNTELSHLECNRQPVLGTIFFCMFSNSTLIWNISMEIVLIIMTMMMMMMMMIKCRLCGRFDETIGHLVSSTATKRQQHVSTRGSAKSLALRWRSDGMSMNSRLSPRRITSTFCGTCPSTLTGPSRVGHCAKEQEGQNLTSHWHDYTPRHQHLSQNHGQT